MGRGAIWRLMILFAGKSDDNESTVCDMGADAGRAATMDRRGQRETLLLGA